MLGILIQHFFNDIGVLAFVVYVDGIDCCVLNIDVNRVGFFFSTLVFFFFDLLVYQTNYRRLSKG